MVTCETAIMLNLSVQISNMDNEIAYQMQHRNLSNILHNLQVNAQSTKDAFRANLENRYNAGNFVLSSPLPGNPGYTSFASPTEISNMLRRNGNMPDLNMFFFSHIAGTNGVLENCPSGLSVICSAGGDATDRHCCACSKFHNCTASSGCGFDPSTPGNGCFERLAVNLFKPEIDAQCLIFNASVDNEITIAQSNLTNLVHPTPLTLSQIQCCQTQIFSGISANTVRFTNINQSCTVQPPTS